MGGLNSMTIVKSINNDDHSPRFRSLKTNHGILSTPFFMPDATRSFIKTLSIDDLKKTKTESIVVNTFHLYLQPGIDVLKKLVESINLWIGIFQSFLILVVFKFFH